MPTPDELRALTEKYAAAWRTKDRDAYVGLFAEDAVLIDPVGTPARHGHQGVGEFFDQTMEMLESMDIEITRTHACANEIAMVFTIHAKAGGGAMAIDAVDIFEVNDAGKVAGFKAYWDEMRPE
jgi:steroid delta-isomerase